MMKRRRLVITGVLLLLGGAIVNVAVAWGLAISVDASSDRDRFGREMYVYRCDLGSERNLPWWCGTECEATNDPTLEEAYRTIDGRGLPLISMWSERMRWPRIGNTLKEQVYRGIPFKTPPRIQDVLIVYEDARVFPLRPIWPGFAINTIFYAVMLWVVFFVPGMVRRRIRRRRGLCPACAYPVGTSPVCTECGGALQPRRGDGM